MKLRKPCQHGRYEEHFDIPEADPPVPIGTIRGPFFPCPGGVFLPDDTLVVEKVDGEWPEWVQAIIDRPQSWPYPEEFLDALAISRIRLPTADEVFGILREEPS